VARIPLLNAGFDEMFERCDAFITPAAAGTAPKGLESTGDPSFCTLWTLCGMPAVNLPLMRGSNGLPLGVQLVGARGSDARLLRTARWLVSRLATAE
jgi:Asp-tRNA(Asn)/Glu-tRNA(Gln) amidotransferase A subunit family amidase